MINRITLLLFIGLAFWGCEDEKNYDLLGEWLLVSHGITNLIVEPSTFHDEYQSVLNNRISIISQDINDGLMVYNFKSDSIKWGIPFTTNISGNYKYKIENDSLYLFQLIISDNGEELGVDWQNFGHIIFDEKELVLTRNQNHHTNNNVYIFLFNMPDSIMLQYHYKQLFTRVS